MIVNNFELRDLIPLKLICGTLTSPKGNSFYHNYSLWHESSSFHQGQIKWDKPIPLCLLVAAFFNHKTSTHVPQSPHVASFTLPFEKNSLCTHLVHFQSNNNNFNRSVPYNKRKYFVMILSLSLGECSILNSILSTCFLQDLEASFGSYH